MKNYSTPLHAYLSNRYFLADAGRQEIDIRYHDLILLLNKLVHRSIELHPFPIKTDTRLPLDSNAHNMLCGTVNRDSEVKRRSNALKGRRISAQGKGACAVALGYGIKNIQPP